MVSLRCLPRIEKGGQPGGENTARELQEKLFHTAPGSKELWSLSDTVVEIQIQWGEEYSQQHFLLFQESRESVLKVKVHLQKPIPILSAFERFLSAHRPMGKLTENLAQEKD